MNRSFMCSISTKSEKDFEKESEIDHKINICSLGHTLSWSIYFNHAMVLIKTTLPTHVWQNV